MKQLMIKPEVWSRVSGYFRPVGQWNPAKKREMEERKFINTEGLSDAISKKVTL